MDGGLYKNDMYVDFVGNEITKNVCHLDIIKTGCCVYRLKTIQLLVRVALLNIAFQVQKFAFHFSEIL